MKVSLKNGDLLITVMFIVDENLAYNPTIGIALIEMHLLDLLPDDRERVRSELHCNLHYRKSFMCRIEQFFKTEHTDLERGDLF